MSQGTDGISRQIALTFKILSHRKNFRMRAVGKNGRNIKPTVEINSTTEDDGPEVSTLGEGGGVVVVMEVVDTRKDSSVENSFKRQKARLLTLFYDFQIIFVSPDP